MDFWSLLSNPQVINAIGTGLQAGGQIAAGQASAQSGAQQRQAAQFAAAQMRDQAGSAIASSQRSAYFEELNAKYVMSAQLAAAAGSGGGASDPTVINLIADTAQLGAYRKQLALYEGEERARQLRMQADATEYEGSTREAAGKSERFGQFFRAGSTLLQGASQGASLFQRFGQGGFGG